MASFATQPERSDLSAESLWSLVASIQRAAIRLRDNVPDATVELSAELAESSFDWDRNGGADDVPPTVSIQQRLANQSPTDILRRWLQTLETGEDGLGGGGRRQGVLWDRLKEAIHDFLKVSIRDTNLRETVDSRVEASMYQFAYGLSHEINNPLANICARAAELARGATLDREKKSLRTIADQAMKAHEMLAEMMLAVKMPALHCRPGDLRSLLVSLAGEWKAMAESRSLVWQSAITDDFLWSVYDPVALSEAIAAGLRNAFEACRRGDAVTLLAERVESSEGLLEIRIAMIDNGPGLSEEASQRAWDLFYSGREAGRGLGIGLAKVKRIIESHQGRVWLVSRAKQGCALEIRLPWKKASSVA